MFIIVSILLFFAIKIILSIIFEYKYEKYFVQTFYDNDNKKLIDDI